MSIVCCWEAGVTVVYALLFCIRNTKSYASFRVKVDASSDLSLSTDLSWWNTFSASVII